MTLIRFDECLSPYVVAAIKAFGLPQGMDVEHPNHCGESGRQDVDWLPSFKAAGGRCIVTGDPKMRGRINERLALQEAGFVAIFPPRKGKWFQELRRYGQASYFFRWLPEIMRLAQDASPGDHFLLPPTFDADATKIVPLSRLRGPSADEVAARRAARASMRGDRVVTEQAEPPDLVRKMAEKTKS